MKFLSRIKFFGLALILGVCVCPLLGERVDADEPVSTAHDSSETSPHDGSQIVTGQTEDQLPIEENTPETKDVAHQHKDESEL
ncbi:MAG: hypothetical protein B7Y25_03770 [Alphaproteobacteria bacterium 16-39-46]|nr:MAG: hypothetical protein B7Y25_03770 [Alphaproteobacteria bacterium 16-39-46]OZA43276.1 MAG: hypothetical protein B7X84_03605 [Alphaproteobacteria bacterium 17-39-52]HQS84057.1 hypothetical protein [Alphaproteobacteria bacterium]HQS93919.1 hypothetical protein [Alphaproteobacteria bacterium]